MADQERAEEGWPLIALMINAPLIGARQRWPHVLHAIDVEGFPIKTWPKGQATSACGLAHVRIMPMEVDGRSAPALWPPNLRSLPKGTVRCEACHQATGRKRPRSIYRAKETADA